MKRILAIALIAGLVAVPTLVSAHRGTDDTSTSTPSVQREDRVNSSNTQSTVTIPSQTTPVRVETESPQSSTTITAESAITQALTVFPGKTVAKVELEHENTVLVYSVRFSDGSRVDVSATDGTIMSIRDFTNHDNRDNEHRQNNRTQGDDDANHTGSVSGRDHAEDN